MRKILSLVVLVQALIAPAFAAITSEVKRYDENAARIISDALLRADYAEVVSSFGKKEYRVRIDSKIRLIGLSTILGSARYEPRPLAWHGTRQQIEVYLKSAKMISVAQDGEIIRCFGAGLSGDYYVGRSICDAVLNWVNPAPEPTAPSGRATP